MNAAGLFCWSLAGVLPDQLLPIRAADYGGVHGAEPQLPDRAGLVGSSLVLSVCCTPSTDHHRGPALQVPLLIHTLYTL